MAEATPPQPPSRLDQIEAVMKRIAERHEALAEAVELFHHDVQSFRSRTEEALEKDVNNIRSLAGIAREDAGNIRALAGIAREALASIQSLERIATAHQTQLDGHEKRIEDLEK